MELVNQPVLHALVSTETSTDRPISNLWRTVIFTLFAAIAFFFLWIAVWAFWPAKTYTVSGFTNLPTEVCPSQPVTITLTDRLHRIPLVEALGVTMYSQPVSLTGEPVFSELPFPIPRKDIQNGETTAFIRNAPTTEGVYFFRLHVETRVRVAGWFATRIVRQDLSPGTERFRVAESATCEVSDD